MKIFPLYCNLILTRNCNLRCKSCWAWKHPARELSTADMKAVVDKMVALKPPKLIGITGGEPLLRPDVYEIIDHISAKGITVQINSNGSLPRGRYQRLLESRASKIGISLGFLTPEKQDEFCGSAGTWDKVVENLRYLKANGNGKFIYVQNTLTGYNYREVLELKRYINYELGLPFLLTPATWGQERAILRTSSKELSQVEPDFDGTKRKLRKFFGMRVVRGRTFLKIAFREFETGKKQWKCKAGEWYYAISPDGKFCLCQDFETDLFILDEHFEKELEGQKTRNVISAMRDNCSGCTYPCYLETQTLVTHPWELIPKGTSYLWWRIHSL